MDDLRSAAGARCFSMVVFSTRFSCSVSFFNGAFFSVGRAVAPEGAYPLFRCVRPTGVVASAASAGAPPIIEPVRIRPESCRAKRTMQQGHGATLQQTFIS